MLDISGTQSGADEIFGITREEEIARTENYLKSLKEEKASQAQQRHPGQTHSAVASAPVQHPFFAAAAAASPVPVAPVAPPSSLPDLPLPPTAAAAATPFSGLSYADRHLLGDIMAPATSPAGAGASSIPPSTLQNLLFDHMATSPAGAGASSIPPSAAASASSMAAMTAAEQTADRAPAARAQGASSCNNNDIDTCKAKRSIQNKWFHTIGVSIANDEKLRSIQKEKRTNPRKSNSPAASGAAASSKRKRSPTPIPPIDSDAMSPIMKAMRLIYALACLGGKENVIDSETYKLASQQVYYMAGGGASTPQHLITGKDLTGGVMVTLKGLSQEVTQTQKPKTYITFQVLEPIDPARYKGTGRRVLYKLLSNIKMDIESHLKTNSLIEFEIEALKQYLIHAFQDADWNLNVEQRTFKRVPSFKTVASSSGAGASSAAPETLNQIRSKAYKAAKHQLYLSRSLGVPADINQYVEHIEKDYNTIPQHKMPSSGSTSAQRSKGGASAQGSRGGASAQGSASQRPRLSVSPGSEDEETGFEVQQNWDSEDDLNSDEEMAAILSVLDEKDAGGAAAVPRHGFQGIAQL